MVLPSAQAPQGAVAHNKDQVVKLECLLCSHAGGANRVAANSRDHSLEGKAATAAPETIATTKPDAHRCCYTSLLLLSCCSNLGILVEACTMTTAAAGTAGAAAAAAVQHAPVLPGVPAAIVLMTWTPGHCPGLNTAPVQCG